MNLRQNGAVITVSHRLRGAVINLQMILRHQVIMRRASSASGKPLTTEHFDQLMAELGKVAQSQNVLAMEVAGVRAAQEEFTTDLRAIKMNLNNQAEHIAKHETLLTDIQAKLQSPTDSHSTVEKDFAKVSQNVMKLKTNAVHCASTLKEIKDGINREKNVLVIGVAGTGSNESLNIVTNVINYIIQNSNTAAPNYQIVYHHEVGKLNAQQNRPRPLKIYCSDSLIAKFLLRHSRLLKNGASYNNVSIKDVKTIAEREKLEMLRDELNNRTQRGETNLTIKYINGQLTIVTQNPPPIEAEANSAETSRASSSSSTILSSDSKN
nr:unnamed protein product [Callosobruchus analis]